jgi:serine/threonine protein kinase
VYPWKATNPIQLFEEVCGQEIDFSLIKDDQARDLISKVLIKDPEKRATLNQMFEHPWITNNDPKKQKFLVTVLLETSIEL